MACSTMSAGWTDQTRSVYWNLKVSPGEPFPPPPSKIHYIFVPTNEKVKQKIISIAKNLSLPVQNVLFQCWAPKEIGKSIILTTVCQPFGLSGVNKELEVYRKGCLDHKLYVHPEQGKAVGLLSQYVVNTFEFELLQMKAGLQSSIKTDCSRRICVNTTINNRKRKRRTPSLFHTSYFRLVPYFGLSSPVVAEKLKMKKGTFRNVCRNIGIPEWPGSPSKNTRASSASGTRVIQALSDTSSFGTLIDDAISSRDEPISELSREEIPMTTVAFASETQVNHTVPVTSLNTDDFNSCWDEGVYEGTFELIIPTNEPALETQINRIASDMISYAEALLHPQHGGIERQCNGTMSIQDLDHQRFMDHNYMYEDAPMMIWTA